MIWNILTMATLFDAKAYRIPNQLIGLGYVAGLYLNILHFQTIGIVYFIIKGILPIFLLYLLYQWKGLGAGDIKLFSVMSTYVGIRATVEAFVLSVMLAGVVVLALIIYERRLMLKRKLHFSYYIAAAFFLQQVI